MRTARVRASTATAAKPSLPSTLRVIAYAHVLLGRHVRGRAGDDAGREPEPREAEIADPRAAVGADEHDVRVREPRHRDRLAAQVLGVERVV